MKTDGTMGSRNFWLLATIFVAIISRLGFSEEILVLEKPSCKLSDELKAFAQIDAVALSEKATKDKDYRYIVFDLTQGFPGVIPEGSIAQNCLMDSKNYKQLNIISDYVKCEERTNLQETAISKATEFNQGIQVLRKQLGLDNCLNE